MNKKYKLAVLTSHSIQYQAPLFKKLAAESGINLTVFFCWDFGVKETYDVDFRQKVKWDIPLLEGYQYKFFKNFSLKPSSGFWGQINPSVIKELINKPDALLVFGWNSLTNWLAFMTAFILKIPIFLRGDNPLNQELLKPIWKRKIKKIIFGWLFKRINAFLYVGEENKKFYQFYGATDKKLFFAPHAVNNEYFIGQAKKLKFKKPDTLTILFMGKLTDKKRPMDLLKAYELLTNSYKLKAKSSLVLVGDGPLRYELEKYVKEYNLKNVEFTGFKNQTDLPRYYGLADILVLPSGFGETWGLAVNEAMCFSLPIVVSSLVGCASDLVKPDKNGYIFPVGNIEALAQCLEDLIKNSKQRKLFGKKSFEIIRGYSYEKDVEAILNALGHISN